MEQCEEMFMCLDLSAGFRLFFKFFFIYFFFRFNIEMNDKDN